MSTKDFKMIASGFADAEAIYKDSPAGMAALQDAQRKISAEIAATHPRFNGGLFTAACFPLAEAVTKERIMEKLWGKAGA